MMYKITHHPRTAKGVLLGIGPITFYTDNLVENKDKRFAPYRAFDGSVWYNVLEEEIEELSAVEQLKYTAATLGCQVCDD